MDVQIEERTAYIIILFLLVIEEKGRHESIHKEREIKKVCWR